MVIKVALARKIQVQILAIFGLWYKYGLCVRSVFSTVCTFDPMRQFFPKLYASYFPWHLSLFLLARVCYTADCNVLTLRRLSCSSTLPTLPTSPGHLIQLTKGLIFIAIILSEI